MEVTSEDTRKLRVGEHYGIHLYLVNPDVSSTTDDDEPAGTALTPAIAKQIVESWNLAVSLTQLGRKGYHCLTEPELEDVRKSARRGSSATIKRLTEENKTWIETIHQLRADINTLNKARSDAHKDGADHQARITSRYVSQLEDNIVNYKKSNLALSEKAHQLQLMVTRLTNDSEFAQGQVEKLNEELEREKRRSQAYADGEALAKQEHRETIERLEKRGTEALQEAERLRQQIDRMQKAGRARLAKAWLEGVEWVTGRFTPFPPTPRTADNPYEED